MTSDPVAVAKAFVDAFNAGNTKTIGALFVPDGRFVFPRLDPIETAAGVRDFFQMAMDRFFYKMTLTPHAVFRDGDHVIMEWTNEAPTRFGWTYRNRGVFVFEIQDGKIREAHEYMDTLQVVPLMEQAGMGAY
jgi:ketosteroid isomerase-like protein